MRKGYGALRGTNKKDSYRDKQFLFAKTIRKNTYTTGQR